MSRPRHLLRRLRPGPESEAEAPPPSEPPDPSEPLRVAALTFCRDEARMLPLWLRYYGDQLGTENLYVVDDNSVDGSTDDLPCDVLRIPPVRGGKFESTRMGVLGGLGRALLAAYDVVVFTDVDEFVVPDPAAYGGLLEFLAAHPDLDAIGAMGLNVVHDVAHEAALDLERPILGQRRLAKFLPVMCKPSIKQVPAPWYAASHGLRAPYAVHPELWMFHMKFADRDHLQDVADRRRALVEADGRSADTNWRLGGDDLVELLEKVTAGADPAGTREFTPPQGERLAGLVIEERPGHFRAKRGSQVRLMESQPLVRIPERFHGSV